MIGVPNTLTAGDSIKAKFALSGYRPVDGWLVSYFFRGPSALDVAAVPVEQSWELTVTPAQTAALAPGFYTVSGVATSATERATFESGIIRITANIEQQVAGYDGRSHARRVLDKIEAVLEGRADKSIISTDIDGFSITHATHADLLALRAKYTAEVRAEVRAANGSTGLILAQFTNS